MNLEDFSNRYCASLEVSHSEKVVSNSKVLSQFFFPLFGKAFFNFAFINYGL